MNWDQVFATRAGRMKASEIRELLKLLDQPDIISFAGGIPDARLFPAEAFGAAYAEVLSGPDAVPALQYSVSEGYRPLRDWLVGHMARLGVTCSANNVFIVSGSQQGLDYLGKLFLSPGDTALVTFPAYMGALGAFNAYEPAYDRLDPRSNREVESYRDKAAATGGRVKFAYCVPDFSNPTGETLSRADREAILDLTEALDIPVIEDAAYQALRFDGDNVPSILALDLQRHNGDIDAVRTVYCGSFSKTLSPGLRLGWIVAGKDLIRKLVLAKQAADLHTSTINQAVMAKVATRLFDAQVDTIRAAYRHRRDRMLAALDRHMPKGVQWTRPEGGMFVWVTLPEGMDGADLLAKSLQSQRVAFVPGRAFHADGSGANTLRLSYSCASDEMIDEGIARLGRLIEGEMAGV